MTHVIGRRNQRFSVIGDTVNTASRMESHSEQDRIQISETSMQCLEGLLEGSGIRIDYRGEIDIKGKGAMKTYWIRHTHRRALSMELASSTDDSTETTAKGDQEQKGGARAPTTRKELLAPLYEYMRTVKECEEDEEPSACSSNVDLNVPLGDATGSSTDISRSTDGSIQREDAYTDVAKTFFL